MMWDSVLDPKYFAYLLEIILALDFYKIADNLKRKFQHVCVCRFVVVSADSYRPYKQKCNSD